MAGLLGAAEAVRAQNAPTADGGLTQTRSVSENALPGTPVGEPVSGSDEDGDTLFYILGGTDAASFGIVANTGQLRTRFNVTYDFATQPSYEVTVTISADTDEVPVAVTINLIRVLPVPTITSVTPTAAAPSTSLDLSWSVPAASSGEITAFHLEWRSAGSSPDMGSVSLPVTSSDLIELDSGGYGYTIPDLLPTTRYSVRVQVQIGDRRGDLSNARAQPTQTGAPLPPQNIQTTPRETSISVTWEAPLHDGGTRLRGYGIRWKQATDESFPQEERAFSLQFNITGLQPNTAYDVQVRGITGVNQRNEEGFSDSVRVTTDALPGVLPVPTEFRVIRRASTTMRVRWEASVQGAEPTGYRVQWREIGTTGARNASVGTLAYRITGLASNKEYEARVAAVASGTRGKYTAWVSQNSPGVAPNRAPILLGSRRFTINEHIDSRTSFAEVGRVIRFVDEDGGQDPDGDHVTFILGGVDAASFSIDANSGVIFTRNGGEVYDFETKASYSVTAGLSDGLLTTMIAVTINLRDVNDPPVPDGGLVQTRTVNEMVGRNRSVGNPVSGSDRNNDPLVYSLEGSDADNFDIFSSSGQIRTKPGITYNFERRNEYFVTVTISDGTYEVPVKVTVRLNDVDETPVADGGSSQTRSMAENSPGNTAVGNPVAGTDPEGNPLTYTLGGAGASSFTIVADTGRIFTRDGVTYNFETQPTYQVTVTISDGTNEVMVAVTITLSNVDEPPVAESGSSQTRSVAENSPGNTAVGNPVTGIDPEGNTVTYTLAESDATTFSIDANGQLRTRAGVTYDFETRPSYQVTVILSDGTNQGFVFVRINLDDVDDSPVVANRPPVAVDGLTQTRSVAENTPGGTGLKFPVAGTDPEGNPLTYTLGGAGASSFTIVADTGRIFTRDGVTYDFETQPTYEVTVTISDGTNEVMVAVTITLSNVDEPPVAESGSSQTRSVAENSPGNTAVGNPVTGIDPEGNTVTYTLAASDVTTFSIDANGQLRTRAGVTYDFETRPSYQVTVILSDGTNEGFVFVRINLDDVNEPPVADGGSSQTVDEGAAVTLNGGASTDPDDDNLTFAWTQSSGDPTVTLADADTATPTFTAPMQLVDDAVLVFSLTVTDTSGAASTNAVTITITAGANDPPTANAGLDQTVAEGAAVTLVGSGTDPEGETLTYAWTRTDSTGHVISLTGENTATPTFTAPTQLVTDAVLVFSLTVTDTSGAASTPATVTITVTAGPNDAPTANAGDAQTVAEGVVVTLVGSGTDPEGETLTYLWTQSSGQTVTLDDPAIARPSFSAPMGLTANADLVFSLTVTDARDLASTPATVTITVTAGPNLAPTANAGPDRSVGEGDAVALDGSGSMDPEGETLTYLWSQSSGQSVTLDDETAARPSFTPPTGLTADIDLVFSLTVNDGNMESPADTVTITIDVTPPTVPETPAELAAANEVPAATNLAGTRITVPTSEEVNVDNAAVEDFTVDVDGDTMTYRVTMVTAGSIILDMTPSIPADAMTISVSYTPSTGSITDTVGNVLPAFTDRAVIRAVGGQFDEVNRTLLPEVARAMADSTVSAIVRRAGRAGRTAGRTATVTLGGQGSVAGALAAHGAALSADSRDFKTLLPGSEFVLPLNAGAGGADTGLSSAVFWGSGEYRSLSGESGNLDWDGDLSGVHLGVDARLRDDLLVGVAVSRLESDLDYDDDSGITADRSLGEGKHELDLTSVYPYIGWRAGQLDLWATAGYGEGELEITPQDGERQTSDVNLRTLGVGGSGPLWQGDASSLRIKGEVVQSKLEVEGSDEIAGLEVDATRVRLTLEGTHTYPLAGGAWLEPNLEIGLRHDSGDGETGIGVELGAGLRYANPDNGLILESKVRTLVGRDDYEEWGIQGLISLAPGADGQGLSVSLSPGYGETTSGVQEIWRQGVRDQDTDGDDNKAHDYGMRLDAKIGYGLTTPRVRGRLTPYTEMTFGERNHYRLGLRWEPTAWFDLNLTGERREGSGADPADHAILLQGALRF